MKRKYISRFSLLVLIVFVISAAVSLGAALWLTQWVKEPQEFEGIEASIFGFGNSSITMNCVIRPEVYKMYPRLNIPDIAVAGDNLLCRLNYSEISKEFDERLILDMEISLCNEKLGVIDTATLNFSEKEQYITFRLKDSGITYFFISGNYTFYPTSGFNYSESLGLFQTQFYVYKSSEEFIKLKDEYELKRNQIRVVGFIGILGSLLSIVAFILSNFNVIKKFK